MDSHYAIFESVKLGESGYAFKVESHLHNFSKLKILCYQFEKKNNKQKNLAAFFMDYTDYRVRISMLKALYNAKREYKFPTLFGGKDGSRMLTMSIAKDKTGFCILFQFNDTQTAKEKEGYDGKLIFSINDRFAIQRLFDTIKTVDAWEMANIQTILIPEKKDKE